MTEQEFLDIEEEQKHTERTGLYISAVKKGYCVCVSHDEKHRIIIKKIQHGDQLPPAQSRILLKTLITFSDLPEQIYLLHQIAQYRSLDDEIKHIANSLSQLKDRILLRFTDKYPKELGAMYDEVFSSGYEREKAKKGKPKVVVDQLKAIYWLFGEEYEDVDIHSRLNVARIVKVWQKKNKRVALFQEKECWALRNGGFVNNYQDVDRVTYGIRVFTPKDKEYNYVCAKREVGLTQNSEYSEVWLSDELFERVQPDELEIIQKNVSEETWLLSANDYFDMRKNVRTERLNRRRTEEYKEVQETLMMNIEEQFSKGSVTRKGIIFTKKSFSAHGISVKGDDIKKFLVQSNIIQLEEPAFNTILDSYIEHLLEIKTDYNYYPHNREMSFLRGKKQVQVGIIKIVICGETRRISVNNYRISRDEVEEVLKRVINYKTQEEYNNFLSETQKVSLKLKNILERGYFQFEVALNRNDDCELKLPENNMVLAIPVIRENHKNYVLIQKKKYSIKNISSFLKLNVMGDRYMWHYEGNPLQKLIVQLHKAVHNFSAQSIGQLIREGIRNHRLLVKEELRSTKEKTQRSEEFVKNAIRLSGAQKIKDGYVVEGLSGVEYSINANTLAVYTVKNGEADEYLCIIDEHTDTETAWGKKDALAKRLLMLSKDLKVAREIYDNGDQMDQHWLKIIGEYVEVEV